jgi:hypothetical protein
MLLAICVCVMFLNDTSFKYALIDNPRAGEERHCCSVYQARAERDDSRERQQIGGAA